MPYHSYQVWGVLLRLYHWSLALSIITLTVTGFYIHEPWANSLVEGSGAWSMATFRLIHFIAGFVFTAAVLVRFYLLLFGNRHERAWAFAPVTPANISNLFQTLLFYAYLKKHAEPRLTHNALAGLFYLLTFFFALGQLLTGFALLYPESLAWQGMALKFFGTQQQLRFIHYLLMWYFMFFAMMHVYIVIWNDIQTKEGLVSSIFNGTKFLPLGSRPKR